MLAACGQQANAPTSAISAAKSGACQSIASINQSLTSLQQTNQTTTVGDVKATQQKLATALNTVSSKLPVGGGFLVGQAQSANNQLTQSLQGQPDNATISQASPQAQAQIQDLKNKVASVQGKTSLLASTLKC
jgi:hypothetical protein